MEYIVNIFDILNFIVLLAIPFVVKYLLPNKSLLHIFVYSFVSSLVVIIAYLWIRDMGIHQIIDQCINNPTILGTNVPEWCETFDANKHMGVGWPVVAIFRIIADSVYLLLFVLFTLFYRKQFGNKYRKR